MVTDCCLDPFRFETTRCFFFFSHLQVLPLRCSWCFVIFHHVLLHHNLTTFLRPQPVLMRPMFGSFGKAVGRGLGQWEDARATSFFIEGTISICCICCICCISQSETLGHRLLERTLSTHGSCKCGVMTDVTRIYLHELRLQGCCAGQLRLHVLVNIVNIYIDISRSKGGSAFW